MAVKHIGYIDGLKGLCGVWLSLFHYLLAFAAFGYIGWESGIPLESRASYYFSYFPYSILSNGSFPVYIFFAIIAFLPAYSFFQSGDKDWLIKQVLTRYFRLMPPVLASTLSAYIVIPVVSFLTRRWELSSAIHGIKPFIQHH